MHNPYIRTKDGQTYEPASVREGMQQFLSDEGYRISFDIEGVTITLRKNTFVDNDMKYLDEHTNATSRNCAVTIRGL